MVREMERERESDRERKREREGDGEGEGEGAIEKEREREIERERDGGRRGGGRPCASPCPHLHAHSRAHGTAQRRINPRKDTSEPRRSRDRLGSIRGTQRQRRAHARVIYAPSSSKLFRQFSSTPTTLGQSLHCVLVRLLWCFHICAFKSPTMRGEGEVGWSKERRGRGEG